MLLAPAMPSRHGLLCVCCWRPPVNCAHRMSPRRSSSCERQRFLRGRIETLDRELEPYERDRLRAPTPDPLTGVPPP